MYSFIQAENLKIDNETFERLRALSSQWMEHRFSLLGSETVPLGYTFEAPGFRGIKYRSYTMKLYGRADKALHSKSSYRKINWFLDFKTGFFFNPIWYNSRKSCLNVMGAKAGVDIKCPWELGRMYHLVPMAVYAYNAPNEECKKIVQEFRDEMTDFIRSNPVGRTVQWSSPMDAAIRIVNVLIAFDILKQTRHSEILSGQFGCRLENHIKKSADYVLQNLEYSGRTETNHYLSNLVGLVFAAAYLPASPETDALLVFAAQELIEQVRIQFYPEGSHFEGSTSYHRLSAEFVLYATALIYGVLCTNRRSAFEKYDSTQIRGLRRFKSQKYDIHSACFFPQWYIDRLCNMGKFTETVLKQNQEITQVGDNDSGRLIKLTPLGELSGPEQIFQENDLDHRTLLSALSGLFENQIFERYGQTLPLENSFIQELAGGVKIQGTLYNTSVEILGETVESQYEYQKESVLFNEDDTPLSLLEGAHIEYFEKFGIVVLKSERIFLSFVVDTTRYGRLYGHTHNDKMSMELLIDGRYITRDPGGYIYTPFPEIRNKFRSTMAHNCVHIEGREQNIMAACFNMKKRARGDLLYCDKSMMIGRAVYGDVEHLRKIHVMPHKVVVCDYANQPFNVRFKNVVISKGYGKLERV